MNATRAERSLSAMPLSCQSQPCHIGAVTFLKLLIRPSDIMSATINLDDAIRISEALGQQLHGLRLPNDSRSRVAFACFACAQQHQSAILILLQRKHRLEATAFALLRPLLEATLRGEWILHCATTEQVKTFTLGGKKQLDMSSVIQALEKMHPTSDAHKILYSSLWAFVSAYTHTYEHQVQHWLGDEIASSYPDEQIAWLLKASCACLALCTASVRSLSLDSHN